MAATDAMKGEWELPPRKKPKISELPLSSTQRASIDSMLHTFKKKGEFDALRKKTFQQYNESAKRGMFEASLRAFTAQEIDRDPIKYLKPDRRIAAPLLEGSAARGDVYGKTEQDIDAYIDQYMQNAERALRGIRADEVGGEQANEEYRKGLKSDEAYAEEADIRRHDREVKFKEDEKKRAKREAQEKKKMELEMLKKKQEALMKETTKLQAEQKRRAEREAWKNAEKERERERIRKYNEDREAAKKKAEEKEKAEQEERERRRRERAEAEQKRLEAEALDLLLKEGQEMAEKARRPELERSESMEPPPRLKHQSAPRNNASKDQMRAQGLMPTSLTLRKGDKPAIAPPTGPRATRMSEDNLRASRARSPSPARSSFSSSRRREPTPDERRGSRLDTRRESSYRDISAERDAWRSRRPDERRERSRSPPRRDRDRDSRVRSRSRGRYDRYVGGGRDRSRDRERDRGEEGEVVERAARSKSRESYRDVFRDSNTYRPAGARRNASQSRSPPRRRERSRSRSPPRRRERSRDRGGRGGRSRSPPGIDRYIPGGPAAAAGASAGKGKEDEEAPRRRARDDEEDTKDKPRESTTRIRDERDRSPPRVSTTRIRDERDRTPARTRERNRSPDRRRSRYDDRDRERSNVGIDRWIPGGGGARDADDDRPRRRERSRPREDRYVPSHRERSRDRDAGRDRDRERERDRDDRDKARDERRPAAKAEGED